MRLEFLEQGDPLPTNIAVAGYPLHVPYSSTVQNNDMYLALGQATTHPGNWELIDYNAFISDGNDGSPIFYKNTLDFIQAIGIVTTGGTGVLLTSRNSNLIINWMKDPNDYQYRYYVPYYHVASNTWTGLALANPPIENDNTRNHIKIEYFSPDGQPSGDRLLDLIPVSQMSFACNPNSDSGWIQISSTNPLYGLTLIGEFGAMSTMFDIDVKKSLHKEFIFPHVAAQSQIIGNDKWTSTAMLCNPNDEEARLTFHLHTLDGQSLTPTLPPRPIPPHGNVAIDIGELFGGDAGGYLHLQTTQPLAAFLLYDDTTTGVNHWRAGLSAVPMD
jgi:hypothetical protein